MTGLTNNLSNPQIKILVLTLTLVVGSVVGSNYFFPSVFQITSPPSVLATPQNNNAGTYDLSKFWENSLADAKKTGYKESRWVLVYFEAPFAHRPPPVRREPKFAQAIDSIAIGATITSDNVLEATQEYKISRLPALVVLDPFGKMRTSWERRLDSQEVYRWVQGEATLLKNQVKQFRKNLDLAKESNAKNDIVKWTRLMIELSKVDFPRLDRWAEYLDLRREFDVKLDRLLLNTLAKEGIDTDYKLGKSLRQLEKQYPYPKFKKLIRYELNRLSSGKIGERF